MRCPHCLKTFIYDMNLNSKVNRKVFILNNIKNKVKKETLYRRIRRKGYRKTRKTFARDLKELEISKYVKLLKYMVRKLK